MLQGIPPTIATLDAIGAVSAIIQTHFDCMAYADSLPIPTSINTLCLAPSGSGKGRSFKLFYQYFINSKKIFNDQAAQYDHGDDTSPSMPDRVIGRGMFSKITHFQLMEALHGIGNSLTLQYEEATWFLRSDLYKNNADVLTQAWSGDPPLEYNSKVRKMLAVDARINIGLRIQPDLWRKHVRSKGLEYYALGFWPRFLIGIHQPGLDAGLDALRNDIVPKTTSASGYHARMEDLAQWIDATRSEGLTRIVYELTPEAQVLMRDLQHKTRQGEMSEFTGISESVARAWETTLRLAVVFHIFCVQHGKVDVEMVTRAWHFVCWSLTQHHTLFSSGEPQFRASDGRAAPFAGVGMQRNDRKMTVSKKSRLIADAEHILRLFRQQPFQSPLMATSNLLLSSNLPEKRVRVALEMLQAQGRISISTDNFYVTLKETQHESWAQWQRSIQMTGFGSFLL